MTSPNEETLALLDQTIATLDARADVSRHLLEMVRERYTAGSFKIDDLVELLGSAVGGLERRVITVEERLAEIDERTKPPTTGQLWPRGN